MFNEDMSINGLAARYEVTVRSLDVRSGMTEKVAVMVSANGTWEAKRIGLRLAADKFVMPNGRLTVVAIQPR